MESNTVDNCSDSKFSIDMSAEQLLELCKSKSIEGDISNLLIDDPAPQVSPPIPPPVNLTQQGFLPTPSVDLGGNTNPFDAGIRQFCLDNDIVVLHNFSASVGLDLELFSTIPLATTNPDQSVEVRTQIQQNSDENWDPNLGKNLWACVSRHSWSTIFKYARYQKSSITGSSKYGCDKTSGTAHNVSDSDSNNCARKLNTSASGTANCSPTKIRFATNIDLSDVKKWELQLNEMKKLPEFVRVESSSNMLSHVEHEILGVNTVQLYMKVPGSRIPGHQANNNFCTININIGPGDCEWFAVPEPYWGAIYRLCEKNQINYTSGSWWPYLEDLHTANIPIYKFIQKAGDLVWINSGCVYWIQALGLCNNIAWNVGPLTNQQYQLAIERYEWNKLQGYKSIVPMAHLSWNLAKKIKITDGKLFANIKKCLLRTLGESLIIMEYVRHKKVDVQYHGRNKQDLTHYCFKCGIEVFNVLFVRNEKRRNVVYCFTCAKKRSKNLYGFNCMEEYRLNELLEIYDKFVLLPD